jgi:hypothetical protein
VSAARRPPFPYLEGSRMNKLTKVALGAVAVGIGLGLAHGTLNLGFDPLRAVGLREKAAEDTRFKVGFLPVT